MPQYFVVDGRCIYSIKKHTSACDFVLFLVEFQTVDYVWFYFVQLSHRIYECVFVASGSLGESAVANLINNFSSTFAENDMKIMKQESWGALNLAYKIGDHTKAHYFMFVVKSEPDAMIKFEKKLKYNDLIIRFLLQRKKESDLYTNPDGISLKMPKVHSRDKPDSGTKAVV